MKIKPNLFLYFGAGFFFFIFWLYWVFPYDALKTRILNEIENRSQGKYRLKFSEMDVSLFGNLSFKKLKVTEKVGFEEQEVLRSPKVEIDFSPFALLSKKLDLAFNIKGKKGDLGGEVQQENEEFSLKMDFNKYPLEGWKILSTKMETGIRGVIDGGLEVEINKADPSRNNGKIDLELIRFSMDEKQISLDRNNPEAALKLPPLKITGNKGSNIKGILTKSDFKFSSILLKGGGILVWI